MIRKLNYTGRKRISRKHIKIKIRNNDENVQIIPDLSAIPREVYPSESRVYIEAYRQTLLERFFYGTVSNLDNVQEFTLKEFDDVEGVLFRVKIVDCSKSNKLLGLGDRIPLVEGQENIVKKIPLLPVESRDLADEIFKLEFSESAGPSLVINSQLGNREDIARHPAFESLVYPKILHAILTKVYLIDEIFDFSDTEGWEARWIIFSQKIPGNREPLMENSTTDEREAWIEDAVYYFTKHKRYKGRFNRFLREVN